jgi:hypothetical protein
MAANPADPDLPSFIRSWTQFYFIVAAWLIFLILTFWLITFMLK